jgi:hypothetical protein
MCDVLAQTVSLYMVLVCVKAQQQSVMIMTACVWSCGSRPESLVSGLNSACDLKLIGGHGLFMLACNTTVRPLRQSTEWQACCSRNSRQIADMTVAHGRRACTK